MELPPLDVKVFISDRDFTTCFPFEEAFVFPDPTPSVADKSTTRLGSIASTWIVSRGGADQLGCERVPLGWKCPLCGVVEVEKLFWRTYFKTEKDLQKLEATERAAAKGSRTNRRRIQKEKLRERRLAVRPFCDNCFACPRCSSGTAGVLGGLQVRLSAAPSDQGGELQYHVSCSYCHWQSFRSFPSMETLLGYLAAMDAYASREDTLRPWRRAQREAGDFLRSYYLPKLYPSQQKLGDKSETFSRLAWDKYIETLRPSQRLPSKHGQETSVTGVTPFKDVTFGVTTVGTGGATPSMPEIPRLNLNFSLEGATQSAGKTNKRAAQFEEEEQAITDEIKERGTIYTAANGMHPAEALDKLRDLYERQQLYEGKQLLKGGNTDMKRIPTYVRCVKEPEILLLQQRDHAADERLSEGSYSDSKTSSLSNGVSKPAGSVPNEQLGVTLNGEAELYGRKQAKQIGLHPMYAGGTPDVDELQRAMLPFNVLANSGISGFTAPTRTGLKKATPTPGNGPENEFAGASSMAFASPRPVTARNVAADGPEAAILEALLMNPVHTAFIESLFSYYIQRARKTQIMTLVRRTKDSIKEDDNSVRSITFVMLDASSTDDPDVQQLLEYWSPMSSVDMTKDEPAQQTTDKPVNCLSDGFAAGPRFIPGNAFTATRNLPLLQFVSAAIVAEGADLATSIASLTFRVTNIGTQTMVIQGLRVVKRNLKGQGCSLKGGHDSGNGLVPDLSKPTAWVRLLPASSSEEAAFAGQVDRAAAALPLGVTEACSGNAPAKEWSFSIVISVTKGSESIAHGFVGLELDVLSFLMETDTDASNPPLSPKPTTGVHGEYCRVRYNTSVVW